MNSSIDNFDNFDFDDSFLMQGGTARTKAKAKTVAKASSQKAPPAGPLLNKLGRVQAFGHTYDLVRIGSGVTDYVLMPASGALKLSSQMAELKTSLAELKEKLKSRPKK